MKIRLILFFIFVTIPSWAQVAFEYETAIPVRADGQILSRAFEGGLNATQFQTMDLNGDGELDLVLYHRMAQEITTYLSVNGSYQWAPEFAYAFPEDVVHWLILKDYDCDGKKDLFTSTSLGIKVYKNISEAGFPAWEEAEAFLTITSGSNIQVSPGDIPGIADINGDGALDILTYRFGSASTIVYYENTGACGDLSFERITRNWGNFEECNCNSFVFDEPCPIGNAVFDTNAIQHAGGKTILPFDADGDGDIDIITSDELCENLYFLRNEGTAQEAHMVDFTLYPNDSPIQFSFFPNAFLEDINFDGLQELIISTNVDQNLGDVVDFKSHIQVLDDIGTVTESNFQNASPFLQHEMIDVGEDAFPTFIDMDNDGDLDLFIGNRGLYNGQDFSATVTVYENIGNQFEPSFEKINDDFLSLSTLGFTSFKPQFIDLNGDGKPDLLLQAKVGLADTRLFYYEQIEDFNFDSPIDISVDLNEFDNPFFADVNDDGLPDLLVGRQLGSLSLYLNAGNLNWSAEQSNFGGLTNDFNRLNPALAVADFNKNGRSELLSVDGSGTLRWYNRPMSLDFNAINEQTALIQINEEMLPSRWGRFHFLAVADIYGNGLPDLIAGNKKGGLIFLRNISEDTENENDNAIIRVVLSPNPTFGEVEILPETTLSLEVYNIHGQPMLMDITLPLSERTPISIAHFPSGLYIFRFSNGEQFTTRKVLRQR